MISSRRRAAIIVVVVALSALVASGVIAATQSSDEQALQPTRSAADRNIERRVDSLVRRMSLDEKLQQIQLLSDGQVTDADARNGVGGVFSRANPPFLAEPHHLSPGQSPLGTR